MRSVTHSSRTPFGTITKAKDAATEKMHMAFKVTASLKRDYASRPRQAACNALQRRCTDRPGTAHSKDDIDTASVNFLASRKLRTTRTATGRLWKYASPTTRIETCHRSKNENAPAHAASQTASSHQRYWNIWVHRQMCQAVGSLKPSLGPDTRGPNQQPGSLPHWSRFATG